MSVSVLIITHDDIGDSLIRSAHKTLSDLPLPITSVTVSGDTDPEHLLPKLEQFVHNCHFDDGLLVLTDLYGSTPSNIAMKLQQCCEVEVVSGVNLPMLIRVLNYPLLGLHELACKALDGGRCGIVNNVYTEDRAIA